LRLVVNPLTENLDIVSSQVIRIRVNCLATDVVGQAMHITGDMVSGAYQVAVVDITDFTKLPAVGLLVLKSSPTAGIVLVSGIVVRAGLLPGRLYFAGPDGFPTVNRPTAGSAAGAFVQVLGKALSSTKLLLSVSPNLTKVVL